MRHREDFLIKMSDGVELAVRIYRPVGPGPFPALFGASPYRFDNDEIPKTKRFLWHETGPIEWYVERGYAYVRLDVRGTGRSGGDYGFFDRRERRDLYETIEWIAGQSWCSGKVGGIGESYYGTTQWFMAAEHPPHLTCIAPYDGHIDLYNGWAYTGGVASDFMSLWWNNTVRPINRNPANGAKGRELPYDLSYQVGLHPRRDEFWNEREVASALPKVTIPVLSIGVWAKLDLHLGGNIAGWQMVNGPKYLTITGAANAFEACADFDNPDFHQRVLLPFYERYLKNVENGFENRPPVDVFVRGAGAYVAHSSWPPHDASETSFFLSAEKSASVVSINDGSLGEGPEKDAQPVTETSYDYPREHWAIGVATLGERGPDPIREILTFTSGPLDKALNIAGPCELRLFLSTTAPDAVVIVRLCEIPANPAARSSVITKGWFRASHRILDEVQSAARSPVIDHAVASPVMAGSIMECRIALMHAAYKVAKGSRLRLEIANGDSLITDPIFSHIYTPDMAGRDTIHHSKTFPSQLLLSIEP